MSFSSEITNGIVTAHIAPGAYMDAGRSGDIAGLEFAVDRSRMSDAPREQRHADLELTLDFEPDTGRALAYLLAEKMGVPMFNAREWTRIEDALQTYLATNGRPKDIDAILGKLRLANEAS